jgi:hypothetical protein
METNKNFEASWQWPINLTTYDMSYVFSSEERKHIENLTFRRKGGNASNY